MNKERKSSLSFLITVQVRTPRGEKTVLALVDSGAEANFVSQYWAKTQDLENQAKVSRLVKAIDGRTVRTFGEYKFPVSATDSNGVTGTANQHFYAVDLTAYNMILGFPWLKKINPDIN